VFGLTILDYILILVLLSYLVAGFRTGFLVSIGALAGFAAGAVAAFFAIPLVSTWAPQSGWRLTVVIAVAVVLVIIGQALGSSLGRLIRRWLHFPPLRVMDRIFGAVINVLASALVLSMLAFSLGSLGMPFITQQVAASRVISTIDAGTPAPLKAWMAQLRSTVVAGGIPRILDGSMSTVPETAPTEDINTAAVQRATRSVVRVVGTAFQCGQNQTGSGFVVAPGRVLTNAHVVAGVNQPVVNIPGGDALPARVVQFDPDHDLAVLAVDGMDTPPLPLGDPVPSGTLTAFSGYPGGGPQQTRPATVEGLSTVLVPNVYGEGKAPVRVYTLNANVEQGNSGGPLLDLDGNVIGLVFAKSTEDVPVGYALALDEFEDVAHAAGSLSVAVAAGHCTSH